MRRSLMGALWFLVFYVVLIIVTFVVPSLLIVRGLPAGTSRDQISQAAMDFSSQHEIALSLARWAAFLIALALAVLGTWKGKLPGTKPKPAA